MKGLVWHWSLNTSDWPDEAHTVICVTSLITSGCAFECTVAYGYVVRPFGELFCHIDAIRFIMRMRHSAVRCLSNRRGQNSHPPLQNPEPIWIPFQKYHYGHPGSRCSKFGFNWLSRYGSAHAWTKRVCVDFLLTYLFRLSSFTQVTVLSRVLIKYMLQHGLQLIMARYTRIINCRPCCNLLNSWPLTRWRLTPKHIIVQTSASNPWN